MASAAHNDDQNTTMLISPRDHERDANADSSYAFNGQLSRQIIERVSIAVALWSVSFAIAMPWYTRRKARRASRALG